MSLLKLTPDKCLEFSDLPRPGSTATLTLENIDPESVVAFKIKTTAPKNYHVRPSNGIIKSGESIEIKVIIQQTLDDAICADRFLVQAIKFDDDPKSLTKEFWASADKSVLQDHKLSVVINKDKIMSQTSNYEYSPSSLNTEGIPQRLLSSNLSNGSSDIKMKYQELIQYCLAVEKQKASLNKELEILREQLNRNNVNATDKFSADMSGDNQTEYDNGQSRAVTQSQSYELWHVVAIVVAAVLVLKSFDFISTYLFSDKSATPLKL